MSTTPPSTHLSKTRYQAGLQCRLRLWKLVFEPETATPLSPDEQAILDAGNEVGELALRLFPDGVMIDFQSGGHTQAVIQTADLMDDPATSAIFEAAFVHDGVPVRCDILARVGEDEWDLHEVKSSTELKPEYTSDVGIQLWVLRQLGVNVRNVFLSHPDKDYVRPDLNPVQASDFFLPDNLTAEASDYQFGLPMRIRELKQVVATDEPPKVEPGSHCNKPHRCEFFEQCHRSLTPHPISELPRLSAKRRIPLEDAGIEDISQIPLDWDNLTENQKIVRDAIVLGRPHHDHQAILKELASASFPLQFVDFETFQPAVPRIVGTRPWQSVPAQWSLHTLHQNGQVDHDEFLHTDPAVDPRMPFLLSLLHATSQGGSIFVYSSYEATQLRYLEEAFPAWAFDIRALSGRFIDLLPIVRHHTYYPEFRGSYSLKVVLPTLVPGFGYEDLDIANGAVAAQAIAEILDPATPSERRDLLARQLLRYCGRDTEAMVHVLRALAPTLVPNLSLSTPTPAPARRGPTPKVLR